MTDESPDLLTGVAAIAAHLGWTERQVKHQASTGEIPTFKVGAFVCARRSTLAKHFEAQERAAAAGKADG